MTEIARSNLDPAVAYTLRMLVMQFFREADETAEFADAELAMLYSADLGVQEGNEPLEAEIVENLDVRHFSVLSGPSEDRTPPDFPVCRLPTACAVFHPNENSASKRGPVGLRCNEEACTPSVSREVGITERALDSIPSP